VDEDEQADVDHHYSRGYEIRSNVLAVTTALNVSKISICTNQTHQFQAITHISALHLPASGISFPITQDQDRLLCLGHRLQFHSLALLPYFHPLHGVFHALSIQFITSEACKLYGAKRQVVLVCLLHIYW